MSEDGYVQAKAQVLGYQMDEAVKKRIDAEVAAGTGFLTQEVWNFIRFLMLDNELQERYNAFIAGERIIGDPMKR